MYNYGNASLFSSNRSVVVLQQQKFKSYLHGYLVILLSAVLAKLNIFLWNSVFTIAGINGKLMSVRNRF